VAALAAILCLAFGVAEALRDRLNVTSGLSLASALLLPLIAAQSLMYVRWVPNDDSPEPPTFKIYVQLGQWPERDEQKAEYLRGMRCCG